MIIPLSTFCILSSGQSFVQVVGIMDSLLTESSKPNSSFNQCNKSGVGKPFLLIVSNVCILFGGKKGEFESVR